MAADSVAGDLALAGERGAPTSELRRPRPGAHIVILSGVALCHNPRVRKEASALSKAGYRVTVLGGWGDPELKRRDLEIVAANGTGSFSLIPVVDVTLGGARSFVVRIMGRLRSLVGRHGIGPKRWRLGHAYPALRKAARDSDADLYIAHLEQGMGVGLDLLREGRRVAVDMEDWYSEDLPPAARRARPIGLLRHLERELLRRGAYATCPSLAMSKALAEAYSCPPPRVIYNGFPRAERDGLDREFRDRKDRRIPSIYWFSQTIGLDRGLEELFAALALVTHDAEVHLRGAVSPAMREALVRQMPERWRGRLAFHGVEANERLLSRISEHDIGFAGEMKFSRSRETTVTNKILHYLLGGLAVIASDTEGQREVADRAGEAVLLYPSGDPVALAERIDLLLGSPDRLAQAKAAALRAAEAHFCWERQEPELLAANAAALARSVAIAASEPPP